MNIKKYLFIPIILLVYLFFYCPNPAEEDISITVENGILPVYSWDGGQIKTLTVREYETDIVVWALESERYDNEIYSPVKHGEVPDSVRLVTNPRAYHGLIDTTAIYRPLQPGKTYKIEVYRVFKHVYGTAYFTPEQESYF